MKIKDPLKIWGLIVGAVCTLLMLVFALTQAITGKLVILEFNLYKEMWIEIVFLFFGLIGSIIYIVDKSKER